MIETDALVIGAGPAGLFAVFELGLQGVTAHVVDVLDEPGGQCIELYPDKPIYDIPGLPRCTGRELTQRLLEQVRPFNPVFHGSQLVQSLEHQADGRWLLGTVTHGRPHQQFLTRTVLIAAGVGAFMPRTLAVPGLAEFDGTQLFYPREKLPDCTAQQVLVVGGEDDAVAAAIALAQPGPTAPHRVTLLHRRDVLQAPDNALQQFNTLRTQNRLTFQVGQISALHCDAGRLTAVDIRTPQDQTLKIALDLLLVYQGLSPKLGPLTQWGLAMSHKQLAVDTATFATPEAGIFAIGDVVTYPGKKKLIVSGFHEATLAAMAAAALIHPEASPVLQYTTSSALLQQRLGVTPQHSAP